MRPRRLILPNDQDDGCPLANAMMALRTLREAYVADDDPEGAEIAQELWDKAAELNPSGLVGDAPE